MKILSSSVSLFANCKNYYKCSCCLQGVRLTIYNSVEKNKYIYRRIK